MVVSEEVCIPFQYGGDGSERAGRSNAATMPGIPGPSTERDAAGELFQGVGECARKMNGHWRPAGA
jgi:hypothetical protein